MKKLKRMKLPLLVETFLDTPEVELIETFENDPKFLTKLFDINVSERTVLIHYTDRKDKEYYVISECDLSHAVTRFELTPLYSNDLQYQANDIDDILGCDEDIKFICSNTGYPAIATEDKWTDKIPQVEAVTRKVYTEYIDIAKIFRDIKEYTVFNLDGNYVYAADLEYDKNLNITIIKCAKVAQKVHGDCYAVDIERLIPDVCSNFEFKMI